MPYLNIANQQVFYQQTAGPASGSLIFIHGSGGSYNSWKYQLASLPEGYRGIAVNLPGHLESEGPPLASVEEMGQWVSKFITKIDPSPPVFIVGHSLGSAIALQTARYYPALLSGLILIGAGARLRVHPDILSQLEKGIIEPAFIQAAFAEKTPPGLVQEELAAYINNPITTIKSDLTACNNFDLMSELAQINTPSLIITGTEDKLTPVKYARYLCDNLPRANLVTIEAAGHFVMQEKPAEVNKAISNFVKEFNKTSRD